MNEPPYVGCYYEGLERRASLGTKSGTSIRRAMLGCVFSGRALLLQRPYLNQAGDVQDYSEPCAAMRTGKWALQQQRPTTLTKQAHARRSGSSFDALQQVQQGLGNVVRRFQRRAMSSTRHFHIER